MLTASSGTDITALYSGVGVWLIGTAEVGRKGLQIKEQSPQLHLNEQLSQCKYKVPGAMCLPSMTDATDILVLAMTLRKFSLKYLSLIV